MIRACLLVLLALGPGLCRADAGLLEYALGDQRLLLLGEMHGSEEVPALMRELSESLLMEGPLIVALELPSSEQASLDAVLAAGGGAARTLLQRPFWQREFQDGRSSRAMLGLIEGLAALRANGSTLRLLAIDPAAEVSDAGLDRDSRMAQRLREAFLSHPEHRLLVLAGNFHVRRLEGEAWNPGYRFLGWQLRDLEPLVVNLGAEEGTVWICTGPEPDACGPRELTRTRRGQTPRLVTDAEISAAGFDAELVLPRLTASPPARGEGS